MHSCSFKSDTCTRTHAHRHEGNIIWGGTSRGPSTDEEEGGQVVERKAASPSPNSVLRDGGWGGLCFLLGKRRLETPISETDLDGRGQRKELSAPFPCQGRKQQSVVWACRSNGEKTSAG